MNISDLNNDGIALDGLDPVAYYRGNPLKGTSAFEFTIEKITYRFANAENLEAFTKEPAKFIPISGTHTSEKMVGSLNQTGEGSRYIGSQTFLKNRNLEDTIESNSKHIPNEIKEDGSVEMQNLSDSES
jgi:YHS domain-containing protein